MKGMQNLKPTDKRLFIVNLLANYKTHDTVEEKSRQDILEFVLRHKDCFSRDLEEGHVTGSAIVVDEKMEHMLLNHHLKTGMWFQFGGHSDGNPNTLAVGLREAVEESGLKSLRFLPQFNGIFNLDVHPIPERNGIPLHYHYDVRIILVGDISEPVVISNESKDIKWIPLKEAQNYNTQPAFLRMVNKVIELNK